MNQVLHQPLNETELQTMLLEKDIQPTPLRLKLLAYLLSTETHPTREKMYEHINAAGQSCSRATVYNTLNLLAEKGLVLPLWVDDEHLHYDATLMPHAHFRCKGCQGLWNLPVSLDTDHVPQLEGFLPERSEIIIYGLCPQCGKGKG